MIQTLKRISLSVVLLGAGALALLLSDLHSRERARGGLSPSRTKRSAALLKHASNPLMDDMERGVLEQLASRGYAEGDRLALRRFCAEGDVPTANAIAKQITEGNFEMAITLSTLSLQCVANANKAGRVIHVFGGVTDPAGAGVGIQRMNSTNKPPWLAGLGTFQPVEQILKEAKRFWPGLQVVGVVWNPVERNSEVCTLKARETCQALGMTLIEATVDQSKDVREAAESLVARGAQAFWTGADGTVLSATAALCETARKARIPVLSNTSGHVREGSLFDLGANYLEVGRAVGALAASILDGRKPESVVITDFMPERLMLNKQVLSNLRDPWHFPEDTVARADLVISQDGQVEKDVSQTGPTQAAERQHHIGLAYFGPDEGTDTAISGLLDGLRELGLEEGRNLEIQKVHANGEIGTIPTMIQALDAGRAEVVVAFSTPVITAACTGVRRKPVVFTYCSDPIAAGAGKSFEDHLPFATGIGCFPPIEEALAMIRQTFPGIKRLGTLYNNAEANSVRVVSVLRGLCATNGIELIEATMNNTSEAVLAAQSLVARGVSAAYLPGDNTAYQAFEGVVNRLTEGRVPLVIDSPEYLNRGALAVVGVGYYQCGFAAAAPLARVLRGEKPAGIPLRNVTEKKVFFNFDVARRLGVVFPPAVLAMETPAKSEETSTRKHLAKRWRLQEISYSESIMIEEAMKGLRRGLKEAGLVEKEDFTLQTLCAQGDMASLGALFDSAAAAGTDLYVVYSTPTLQTAIRKVSDRPVVFTVVADPFILGAGRTDAEHLPNFTGVYTLGPYREMAALLRDSFPQIKRIGTLFCPAEANSVANKDLFAKEANKAGLVVETVAVNSPAELPDAAMALCGRRLDAVVQVLDNLTVAGFPAVARAADLARIPVFGCQGGAVRQGAVLALARDYYDAGREAGLKAAQIMRGTSPARIPFAPPSKTKKLVNPQKAAEVRLVLPASLLKDAERVTASGTP
jgi:ABC-type uncharacterized transport system substrate-binding protein